LRIYIAKQAGYLKEQEYLTLNKKAERIGGMIGSLIKTLKAKQ
jgi:four helix bundle protein